MTKIEKAEELIRSLVGCPYIYGAYGQECTTAYRRTVIAGHPDYTLKITNNCPILSGKQSSCSGCKYKGKKSFDCRGLTWYVCDKAGLKISKVGATTQWKTDSWKEKGTIDKAPKDKQCIVFRQDDQGVMQHTGFRCADGTVIDSRGHAYGVVSNPEASYAWTHYAIPYGADELYEEEPTVLYQAKVITKDDPLNMREVPSTSSKILTKVPKGATVDVLAEYDENWSRIRYGEFLGYSSSQYLERENTSQEEEKPVDETTAHVVEIHSVITDSAGNKFYPVGEFTVAIQAVDLD